MCGIVGIVGRAGAPALVVDGLAQLEYRGYDSAGVCWVTPQGLGCLRTEGRVAELRERLPENLGADTAVGHTRWATHGIPAEKNAHPQLSFDKKIAVVHNGIIDNYAALRAELEAGGVVFASDTDTEAVAHLVAKAYAEGPAQGDLTAAVAAVLPRLDGMFAFGIVASDKPGVVVAARRGSPLALGFADGYHLLASDAVPLLAHTRRVAFMEDDWLATLSPQGCAVSKNGEAVEPRIVEIDWSVDAAGHAGHDHFMHKEIFEQPAVLERMVRDRLVLPEHGAPILDESGVDFPADYFRGIGRIVLLAQGTAYHAAMVARNMLERTARVPTYAEYAADFRYRDPILSPDVLVLAVTQSGETMDTLGAIRLARQAGCKVISFVNAMGSSAARESDGVFYLNCGPEIGVASTKAFTAMIAGLYLFSLRLGLLRGTLEDAEARRRALDLMGVGTRVEGVLQTEAYIRHIACKYKDARNFLFLGRGTGWPLALEGALKLKEVSYIHAEGYDAAEMKHGPIALIDEHMPALFIALKGRRYDKIVGNIQEVKARGGKIIALASHDDADIAGLADDVIYIRADSGVMNSIVSAVPLQLLAYHIAVARGCDVDKPKNLAKSVTVE